MPYKVDMQRGHNVSLGIIGNELEEVLVFKGTSLQCFPGKRASKPVQREHFFAEIELASNCRTKIDLNTARDFNLLLNKRANRAQLQSTKEVRVKRHADNDGLVCWREGKGCVVHVYAIALESSQP